jgi:hypothetical protein
MRAKRDYDRSVFVNCAFDSEYIRFFRAIVFTVHNCGFIVRCALEAGSGVRIDRIYKIIAECKFGIHDLSRVEITAISPLPRFNMPYELGVFMGCKHFGDATQRKKEFLVLDSEAHRYKRTISDLGGYDFDPYTTESDIIAVVRNWLHQASGGQSPGPKYHQDRYTQFLNDFPAMCLNLGYDPLDIPFQFYYALVTAWIQNENAKLLDRE